MIRIDGLSNTLSEITLDSETIENSIQAYDLRFLPTRRSDIEWGMRLPMFVTSFYDYLRTHANIPTQEDYYDHYIGQNQEFFNNQNLTDEQIVGLRARIYRTYPSLVRDIHFGMTLREIDIFEDVFYNEILDIQYGIDIVVEQSSEYYGINLFIQTSNAQHAREVKKFRPKRDVGFDCIEIPIHFRESKICGNFYLYSDREINQIAQAISNQV